MKLNRVVMETKPRRRIHYDWLTWGFRLLDKLVLVSVRHIITFFYNYNKKNLGPSAKTLAAIFVQGQLEVRCWPLLLHIDEEWRENSG